ncbi:mannose-1-phosphate guanylyltransferase/mannose-6-phosphate isomerase [Caulobacter flavus]|uniref:mannose-1-phosphate guanylyltransferase n=1 Tax=Caulobacter flavus TaxID=1679497 RepID=A0A2N5D636_9CAUL|nr:mannose-1-phosphate guanylyltransferase/mannose-6-phosphate isomerase [Caulobacter flavus]AYV45929.1 mannose-1-phosphate guanylyltransferase/mannose-6-phosphate isomerase [Caulobacter flavus]PLR21528.1 mannose-1-phosphate guanylyltransferase/mannose-6-phosphate isomerase [Caulobacter flavus]
MTKLYPVILCGGSGTRLWPASRLDRPKQFLKLLGPHSSFQETLLRVRDLAAGQEIIIVTGAAMIDFVREQAREIETPVVVLLEPEARDSAPAVAAAAAYVEALDPDAVALMLAADHHVGEVELFKDAARLAAHAASKGLIVTFGVRPTGPATGFGYIRPGAALDAEGVFKVAAFVEKPDLDLAKTYVSQGYLWNSGNFAFKASTMLAELENFEPLIARAARDAVAKAERADPDGLCLKLDPASFAQAPRKSLDYAIMERTHLAAVVPAAFSWSDLGAWDAIWGASPQDGHGNAAQGDVTLVDTRGVLARSTGPFVGAIGVSDLMIVAEPDAVLVCRRDDAQAVKTLVDRLKANGRDLAQRHPVSETAGLERRVLSKSAQVSVEMWRLAARTQVALPGARLQLLQGRVKAGDRELAPGDYAALAQDEAATALTPATVLVTLFA